MATDSRSRFAATNSRSRAARSRAFFSYIFLVILLYSMVSTLTIKVCIFNLSSFPLRNCLSGHSYLDGKKQKLMLTVLLPGLLPGTTHYTVPLARPTPGRHDVSLPKALKLGPGSKHLYKPQQCLTTPLPLLEPKVLLGPESLTEDNCLLNTEC